MESKNQVTLQGHVYERTNEAQPSVPLEGLVEKARGGNHEALIELCRVIAQDVLFRSRRILLNDMDAEDAAQEVLIRVCASIRKLKEPKAFNAWLASIVINESRRIQAKKRKETVLDIEEYTDSLEDTDEALMPQQSLLKEEDRKSVITAIDQLPERQREAVVLHYYDGLSVTQTATVMGIQQQNASHYLKLARDKIRSELKRKEGTATSGAPAYLTAAPIGAVLSGAMGQEAAVSSLGNTAWANQAVEKCIVYLNGVLLKTRILDALRKAALLALLALFVTAVALFVVGLWNGGVFDQGQSASSTAVLAAEGEILFTGGDATYFHLNPEQASPLTSSTHGQLTVLGWEITSMDGRTVLFSGTDADVSAAFAAMKLENMEGEFLLSYSLVDARGRYYALNSNFIIRTS
ncbi:MAG: sigma-70 family RNA polymerase sigma factor [Coriobacteriia bacterium]|nr:sigma-70 family RNA polymerase sigma factor [Coriobacteriia bacterium]